MTRAVSSLSAAEARHLARALRMLLRAKAMHMRHPADELLARLRRPVAGGPARLSPPDPELMRWSLAAVSRRLPWRSDCLVQALAGRLWMEEAGLSPEFHLAVQKDEEGGLSAHAWLTLDGRIVTGGDLNPALARLV